MTQIQYGHEGLTLHFPGWEAMMVGRRSLHLPRHTILATRTEPGWTSEILGMRSGLVVSGFRKLGIFTHPSGTRRLVSMKRNLPLLRIATVRSEAGLDEVLLSTVDAETLSAGIKEIHAR